MKSKQLLLSTLLISAALLKAQAPLNIKIATALDDHQEHVSGANPQTGTLGDMYVGSTTLNLGNFTSSTDPVLVGLRFTNVTIPKFATNIQSAYIQFTVKGTGKNFDPCSLTIQAENSANSAAFTDNANSLSSRTLANGSISWNISGTSWNTVGSAGTDQRTPDLKTLIQPIIFNNNWASGNAMSFFLKGSGVREVEAFESDPAKAAELVINFTGTQTATAVYELSKASYVELFPNPCKNNFQVNIGVDSPSDISISTYDLTGKLMEHKNIKQYSEGNLQYTSSTELAPGMYLVKVKINEKEKVYKLIAE